MNLPAARTSSSAVVSLVFGLPAWTVVPIIGALVAIICGHVSRSEIQRMPPGSIEGGGTALAGLILGWLQSAVGIAVLVFLFGLAGLLVAFGAR